MHHNTTVGIFEGEPPGEVLYEKYGHPHLNIWIANTKYSSPWIVLGATPTEEEFWDVLQTDSILENYAPQKPAQPLQVYFMTQDDATQMETK